MAVTQRTLLLVDADPRRRAALAEQLCLHEEVGVQEAASPAQAPSPSRAAPPDAVLLDPGEREPADAVRELRRAGPDAVVIVLSRGLTPSAAAAALEAGALDCTDRTQTRTAVLMARLRAHLRAQDRRPDAPVALGPLQLRPWLRLLENRRTGRRVNLTEKEVSLLRALVRAGESAVDRYDLLRAVWRAHPAVETHTVETHVYRLRRKLADVSGEAVGIERRDGGYRLSVAEPVASAA